MENLSPDCSSFPIRKRLKKTSAIGCSTVSSTVPKNEEKATPVSTPVSTVLSLSCDYSRENSDKKSKIVSQTALPEVSIELTRFRQSWITDIQRTSCQQRHAVLQEPASCNSCNLERMKFYTAEDLEEERRKGVSTNLSLSYGYNTVSIVDNNLDLWKIKKKLNKSDLGNLSRLLISTDLVQKHILPLLSSDLLDGVVSSCGIPVTFWDVDTETKHKLIFKKWATSRSYVFVGGWTRQFVQRRNLKEGDEVGIYWDVLNSRFNFCVIRRA
ncbi:hypothetical protein JCGZ_01579 [Jatropha curcas]|uniref:TF-B3 domain-containing protein n=2 Tax=Jatropha curcas TaxID=180498 RepID=A0A067LL43_JATCU|nr:hypothetical protein JCGZ_01579 [Jatropha curcas]